MNCSPLKLVHFRSPECGLGWLGIKQCSPHVCYNHKYINILLSVLRCHLDVTKHYKWSLKNKMIHWGNCRSRSNRIPSRNYWSNWKVGSSTKYVFTRGKLGQGEREDKESVCNFLIMLQYFVIQLSWLSKKASSFSVRCWEEIEHVSEIQRVTVTGIHLATIWNTSSWRQSNWRSNYLKKNKWRRRTIMRPLRTRRSSL